MPEVSIDLNMIRVTNEEFVKKAEVCAPKLYEKSGKTCCDCGYCEDGRCISGSERGRFCGKPCQSSSFQRGQAVSGFRRPSGGICDPETGFCGKSAGCTCIFQAEFGEIAKEMTEDSADYDGWISRGWIQEEFIHVDVLPTELKLPRRYAFRYLEIEAIDTSLKWQLVVEDVTCVSVSAVNMDEVKPFESDDKMICALDKVSLRTLMNCMQSVFEDGPKRDRRLWLGDLRLQALANYGTFRNFDLVKRCLYLFAAQTRDDGW